MKTRTKKKTRKKRVVLSDDHRKQVRRIYARGRTTQAFLAVMFGVSQGTISRIVSEGR